MCSWNGWLLERGWIPLLILSLIMVATFGFGHVGLVPGFKLSLNRFAECPLNFPITGVNFHETRAFSTTQKYRMFAGNANGVVILIAGVIGSFGLTNDGLAKRNARSFVLPAGCVMVFLHAQSTFDRLRNGTEATNHRGIVMCIVAQAVFAMFLMLFMVEVSRTQEKSYPPAVAALIFAGMSLTILAAHNFERFRIFAKGSFDVARFDNEWFKPQGAEKCLRPRPPACLA